LGLSISSQGQSTSATATGNTPQGHPRHQLEGTSAMVETLSNPESSRPTRQPSGGSHGPCTGRIYGGHGPTSGSHTLTPKDAPTINRPPADGFQCASEAAQPRCGATRDGVKRPPGILVPRARQAPDGCQSGGTQSTEISRINRRVVLAPALPMTPYNTRMAL
jgi:hypothetical protein